MKLSSIKKKIRGLKRKSKNIDRFFESIDKDNLKEQINNKKDFYIKLYIDPWFRLYDNVNNVTHKTPEKSLQKKMIVGLLKIYLELFEITNNTDYFQIWIFEKEFMGSQMVYSQESKDYYEKLFYYINKNQFNASFLNFLNTILPSDIIVSYCQFQNGDYIDNVICLSKNQ